MGLTVLGGGPAGVAVAYYAHRRGIPVQVFERDAAFGGLCRTLTCGPHRYDTGAHRFHDQDAEITADLRALLGDELAAVDAPSQIFDRGRFFDFPPTPLNWLRGLGPLAAAGAAGELLRARWRPRPERTFEDRAVNRYGRRLGEPLLLQYSAKLWGLPASALSPDVATRRLSGMSLRTLVVEMLTPARKSAHLDGTFWYPRRGYGQIVDHLVAAVPADAWRPGHEIVGLDCAGDRVSAVRFRDRPPLLVSDRVAATVPLTRLVDWLADRLPASVRAAAARLRFRDVRLLFLRLAVPRCSRNATIYLPDARLAVSRISEPKNRSTAMAPPDETGLVAEVPCSAGEPLAGIDDAALASRVIGELSAAGLIDAATVVEWRHHRLPNAYPVYALHYAEAVTTVVQGLGAFTNLDLLGRNGRFWYSHLHDQLRAAKDYAEDLAATAVERRRPAEHRETHATVGGEAVVRPSIG